MLERYYAINRAVGLGIRIQKDGTAIIHGCQLSVSNKQLSFDKKLTEIVNAEIGRGFDKGLPAAINLQGRGILQKRIEKIDAVTQMNFSLVLPNASLEDFYVQHFVSGDFSFVAAIRKSEADKWIKEVRQAGLVPLMLSLGPYPVEHIMPQLNFYEQEIRFDGHIISRDGNHNWTAYRFQEEDKAPFIIKVENEQVDQRLLLPYAAAFQLVLSDKVDPIHAGVGSLENDLEEALERRKLKTSGFLILIAFFAVLLLNFIVLSSLNSANAKLSKQVSQTSRNSSDLKGMTDLVHRKEALLKDLGWNAGLRKAVMTDQIAAMMPGELSLKYLSFNAPQQSGTRGTNAIHFSDGRILIRGLSRQIIPVNEWVARLKTYKWVKNISMDSYSYNNELETGVFTITINY